MREGVHRRHQAAEFCESLIYNNPSVVMVCVELSRPSSWCPSSANVGLESLSVHARLLVVAPALLVSPFLRLRYKFKT